MRRRHKQQSAPRKSTLTKFVLSLGCLASLLFALNFVSVAFVDQEGWESKLREVRQAAEIDKNKLLSELREELEHERVLISKLKENNLEIASLRAHNLEKRVDFNDWAGEEQHPNPNGGYSSRTVGVADETQRQNNNIDHPPIVQPPAEAVVVKGPEVVKEPAPPVVAAPPPTPIETPLGYQPPTMSLLSDDGRAPTALLVICYNRPDYLKRTLESVLRYHPGNDPSSNFNVPVIVSQDGNHGPTSAAVQSFSSRFRASLPSVPFLHVHHTQESRPGDTGYHKLARHFGWALGRVFDQGAGLHPLLASVDHVIILEDDLEIAPDFFSFFASARLALEYDHTLLAASAWNDNGRQDLSADPEAVLRSDFFPGLGWMLPRRAWQELGPKWPVGYWDDWMRLPEQRQGRAFLRPEVCRSYTFGSVGVSTGQFFNQYLSGIVLNSKPVDWTAPGAPEALAARMLKSTYDKAFVARVQSARTVPVSELVSLASKGLRGSSSPNGKGEDLRVEYSSMERGASSFVAIAKKIGAMADVKAGVPRTAYKGVLSLTIRGIHVFLAPADPWW